MITAAVLALALSGAPDTSRAPPPPPVAALTPAWWPQLDDPVLRDLLTRASQGSLDLKIAVARLERAGADVDLARAGQRPHATVGADAAIGAANFSSVHKGAGVPASVGYEVDLFGRLKASVAAARSDQAAAQADVEVARQLVMAETAKAYVDLREAQAKRAATEGALAAARRNEELVSKRRAEGDALGDDVQAAHRDTRAALVETDTARRGVESACIRLGQLLGQDGPIDEPAFGGAILTTPALEGLPSEAVLGRPDIQAAQARLQAADARRAEAVAATRPRFTLTGSLGGGEPDLFYLLDVRALAWSVVGGLTHELYDGGAGKARKRGATADATLAELAYRKAVGDAWAQARLALGALDQATIAESLARETLAQAERTRALGQTRHGEGEIDGGALTRLDAAVSAARAALADASAARARAYLDLILAAGGRA